MEQNPSGEADCYSTVQEIGMILWKQKIQLPGPQEPANEPYHKSY
jgi:hypothetical protein